MNWTDLLSALALLLVLESIMPFLDPGGFRRVMAILSRMDDRSVRLISIISMVSGLVLLYVARF